MCRRDGMSRICFAAVCFLRKNPFLLAGGNAGIPGGFCGSLVLVHCIVRTVEYIHKLLVGSGIKLREASGNADGDILCLRFDVFVRTFRVEFCASGLFSWKCCRQSRE